MVDKNSELLFEYLRSILYDPKIKQLDIESLDEPFQKLGLGLQFLEKEITEMKEYSAAISKGNLLVKVPEKDNLLCENLKNIHANLKHLTWQAKQVAKGDYSQTVSYLGEFSDAFNTMTKQLEERETRLKQEAEKEKAYAKMLNRYNQELEVEANQDELTQIGNRHFFIDKMEKLLKTDEDLIICYCDLDHLKYINDKYGHAEGDWYIRYFVKIVKKHIREHDIFTRIGGDEFCIVLCACPVTTAMDKIEQIQTIFHADITKGYPKSFSCGIIEVPKERRNIEVMDIIKQADAMMYEQKKTHKKTYQLELK